MAAPRSLRLTAACGVLLVLIGVWLGHTLEYLRVWGTAGLGRALTGSSHVYMLPLGLILAGTAALAARRGFACWQRLASRLDRAMLALRHCWRGRRPDRTARSAIAAPPTWGARILSLGAILAAVQTCVYLLQENVEALAAHLPMPGLGAITGVHWAASLIQLDVAFVLLAIVVLILRRFRSRIASINAIEALVRTLVATLRPRSVRLRAQLAPASPHEWLGDHAWSRPPPDALTAH